MTNIASKFGFGGGGAAFTGNFPPYYLTDVDYLPMGYCASTTGFNTTATRVYYIPLPIFRNHTFQGAGTQNTGTGDNAEKIRLMVFNAVDGIIGTLAKDFGEITLDNTAAVRFLSSSWNAVAGMYWAAVWTETAIAIKAMKTAVLGGGEGMAVMPTWSTLGSRTRGTYGGTRSIASHHMVDTAYGAAPSTAVAPTATETADPCSATGSTPLFFLRG